MTSTETETDARLTLAITRWGQPSAALPLILLHGIGGLGQDWSVVAEQLGRDREVIAPDARGHGDSPWSPEEAYHADAHFSDVAVMLDALGIERCVLVGYSMGGGVAILTAAALPERVAGLVVVDAYPAAEMTVGSREIAHAMGRYADGPPLLPDGRPRFDPAIARRMSADLEAGRPRTDLWPMWDALACPTLVIRGETSTVLPVGLAAEMMARQPLARRLTVAGCGHQVLFRRPHELAQAITEFASSCDRRRR